MEMDVTVQRKEKPLQTDRQTDEMTQQVVSTCDYEYIYSKMERSLKADSHIAYRSHPAPLRV